MKGAWNLQAHFCDVSNEESLSQLINNSLTAIPLIRGALVLKVVLSFLLFLVTLLSHITPRQ